MRSNTRRHYYSRSVRDILLNCVNLEKLAIEVPEKFSFDSITTNDKITLVKHYPTLTKNLKFTADEKMAAALILPKDTLNKAGITVDKKTVEDCSDAVYAELVEKSSSYFDIERYKASGDRAKGELFSIVPKKVLDAGEPVPGLLSNRVLYDLANKNVWVFEEDHITDFTNLVTDSEFWCLLLKTNYKKFAPIFLSNLKNIKVATEVRQVFDKFPELVKMIDDSTIANSNLTAKQWTVFIKKLMKSSTKLKNWSISEELKETLKLDIMTEVLSGKSKLTKVLQNTISDILQETKEEENEESSQTVQPQP